MARPATRSAARFLRLRTWDHHDSMWEVSYWTTDAWDTVLRKVVEINKRSCRDGGGVGRVANPVPQSEIRDATPAERENILHRLIEVEPFKRFGSMANGLDEAAIKRLRQAVASHPEVQEHARAVAQQRLHTRKGTRVRLKKAARTKDRRTSVVTRAAKGDEGTIFWAQPGERGAWGRSGGTAGRVGVETAAGRVFLAAHDVEVLDEPSAEDVHIWAVDIAYKGVLA